MEKLQMQTTLIVMVTIVLFVSISFAGAYMYRESRYRASPAAACIDSCYQYYPGSCTSGGYANELTSTICVQGCFGNMTNNMQATKTLGITRN